MKKTKHDLLADALLETQEELALMRMKVKYWMERVKELERDQSTLHHRNDRLSAEVKGISDAFLLYSPHDVHTLLDDQKGYAKQISELYGQVFHKLTVAAAIRFAYARTGDEYGIMRDIVMHWDKPDSWWHDRKNWTLDEWRAELVK